MSNVWVAFALTAFAGLATGIGSAIAFFAKRTNYRFLSLATGFSAGVMIYVSFLEIMPKALTRLCDIHGRVTGNWVTAAAFFGGIALITVIDQLIPKAENPHEVRSAGAVDELHHPKLPPAADHTNSHHHRKLLRMGVFTALAITIHNFPEGMATFLAALEDPGLGLAIAIAIALHNIPEGISVSVPVYYATGSRRRAFAYSLLSGLAEPVGAAAGYLVLRTFLTPSVMGILFASVAGIMVYISLDELLPTSRAYGKGHDSLLGLLAGMVVMAMSLLLMQ
jgi:ZIP family zinc transporter